jgi:GTPase SAR1 family protein
LTLEASLREVANLRQQILRIKGENSVSSPRPPHLPRNVPKMIAPLVQRVPMVLVGTKSDLTSEREVSRSCIEQVAAGWKIPLYETSAKRDWNVSQVFEDLVRQMRRYYPAEEGHKRKGGKGHHGRVFRRSPCMIM